MQPSPDQASENPPDQPEVILDRHGEIAAIRVNRPTKLNAATYEHLTDIITALDNCDADDDVRAVVLTGTGRAFCAGADISGGGDTFAADPDADTGAHGADPLEEGSPGQLAGSELAGCEG